MDMPTNTEISIVIASIVGASFLDDCIHSVEAEARELNAEVIVVACGSAEFAASIRKKHPWVKVIHRARRETVPELRLCGVEAARTELVAIIEEHCRASNRWLHTAIEAHRRGDFAAVGGPVVDYAYRRIRDWVVYFCEYNGYLPPAQNGEVFDLNGANIAYRREILIKNRELLTKGYWEASLHPVLISRGMKFLSVPDMAVHHCGPFDYGYYLKQRYWFSRAFAGSRATTLPLSQRVAYFLAAPIVPFLLLARMAKRVYSKQCQTAQFAKALPLIMGALTIYVAGEWVGYLAGPGDALSKVE